MTFGDEKHLAKMAKEHEEDVADMDNAQAFLLHSRCGIHPNRNTSYVDQKYDHSKHSDVMTMFGLPDLLPCDLIFPIEDAIYSYWLEQDQIVDKPTEDDVLSHRKVYSQKRRKDVPHHE